LYARSKARHWIRFLFRHGRPDQIAAFFCIGAPVLVLRMVVREGRKGNLRAVLGSLRGALESVLGR
jgi:hypothetical protein